MPTMREIKRRQRGIDNIRQITNAMYMVAAVKMRRVEDQVHEGRPYAEKLAEVLGRLVETDIDVDHPLLEERERSRVAIVAVTGDRGLCGSYNNNIVTMAREGLDAEEAATDLIAVGRYGRNWFRRRGYDVEQAYINLGEEVEFVQARAIARYLAGRFTDGDVDEVRIFYTAFHSAMRQEATWARLLPLTDLDVGSSQDADGDGRPAHGRERPAEGSSQLDRMDYIYEPSAEEIFQELLPRFMEIRLYRVLMEAKAAEHAARMRAMQNATENAEEMLEELQLEFNRARQSEITSEIADIVGGAEALRQA